MHNLDKTPLEGSHDVFVCEESPSLGFDDSVIPNLLDHSHILPICSLPFSCPEYDLVEPINNLMIFDANVDLGYEDNEFNVLGGNVDGKCP